MNNMQETFTSGKVREVGGGGGQEEKFASFENGPPLTWATVSGNYFMYMHESSGKLASYPNPPTAFQCCTVQLGRACMDTRLQESPSTR